MADAAVPRAQVHESGDGEVSCSVEETNRIRAALGLRPLDVGPSATARKEVDARAELERAREAEDIKARIDKARREREAAEAGRGRSLGEVLTTGALSAADWVAQARRTQTSQLQKAAVKRTTLGDLDDEADGGGARSATGFSAAAARVRAGGGADDVTAAGLRIGHGADAFAEGQSVILTLKDTALLDEKGTGLADAEDELVSTELAAAERTSDALARKAMLSKPVYSGVDYEPHGSGSGAAILPQYDEEANTAARKRAAALVIGAGGVARSSEEGAAAAEAVRARLAAAAASRANAVDLGRDPGEDGPKLASDYYSAAEMAAFAARAGAGNKKGKKKGLRPKGGDDEPAAAPAAAAAPPADAAAAATGEQDRGSRAARRGQAGAARTAEEAAVQAGQQAAFDSAVAKASERSAAVFGAGGEAAASGAGELPQGWADAGAPSSAPLPIGALPTSAVAGGGGGSISDFSRQRVYARLRDVGGGDGDDDDNAELTAMLARARRLAQQAAASSAAAAAAPAAAAGKPGDEDRGAADVAARMAAMQSRQQHHERDGGGGDAAAGIGGEGGAAAGEGMVVFTETTEFARLLEGRILTDQAEHQQQQHDDDAQAAGASASASAPAPGDGADAAAAAGGARRKRRRWEDAEPSAAAAETAAAAAAASSSSGWGDVNMDDDGAGGGSSAVGGIYGGASDDDDDDDEDDDDGDDDGDGAAGDSFTGREPELHKGVAGALAMFARTGAMAPKQDKYVGRTKDARPDWDAPAAGGAGGAGLRDVKLEYRDKHGNKLTPKEAYRELCYKFHGREPSQKVKDKRMRKMKREAALERVSSTDTPLGSLAAMQRAQEARGAAHIPLGK